MRQLLAAVVVACAVAPAAFAGPIHVTLTAASHRPHPSASPSWQWGYCVKVRTAAGTSVASTIRLQFLLGGKRVGEAGIVSLRKGYDHWCASIGGETNVLLAVPRGKRLVFQAVVTAEGVTVKRNWPLVVR